MSLNLDDWDMHDIHVEMRDKSIFQIMCLYQDRVKMMSEKAVEYLQAKKDENKTAIDRIETEFNHFEKEKVVIALEIVDQLIKGKQ